MRGLDGNMSARWDYTDNLSFNAYKCMPGWNDSDPPMEAAKPFLSDVVETPTGTLEILPLQEQVDGHWCHVLDFPDTARYWVDVKCGCVVRKWQFNWKGTKILRRVIENSQVREVKPGLWLPLEQRVSTYAEPETEERKFWGQKTNERDMSADVAFNIVADSDLAINALPGTFVTDNIQLTRYRIASPNQEPFEDAIEFGKRVRGGGYWTVFLYVQALAILLALAFEITRRLKRR